jgi:hypothetical protein
MSAGEFMDCVMLDDAFSDRVYRNAVRTLKIFGLSSPLIHMINYNCNLNTVFEARKIGYRTPTTAEFEAMSYEMKFSHTVKLILALEQLLRLREA